MNETVVDERRRDLLGTGVAFLAAYLVLSLGTASAHLRLYPVAVGEVQPTTETAFGLVVIGLGSLPAHLAVHAVVYRWLPLVALAAGRLGGALTGLMVALVPLVVLSRLPPEAHLQSGLGFILFFWGFTGVATAFIDLAIARFAGRQGKQQTLDSK
jgi:hypothetical protein